jgi:predicted nucleotidyltransferase
MRVTRESLLRIAKETAQERAYNDIDIVAAYLTGSLLNVEPMLGGTADIDIVFVHKNKPAKPREFVKLTPDFHLDISRRAKDEFKSPRELRSDPWLGYEMYDPIFLYEREKFFDFIQASLRAGFDFEQPPLMLQRCRKMLSHGRQIWMDIAEMEKAVGPGEIRKFMKSLFHVLNAVAELSGPPIQERRLLLEFPVRANAAQQTGLIAKAFGLIGANNVDVEKVKGWVPDWKSAFTIAGEKPNVDLRINPIRTNYYEKAIKAMLEGEISLAALWPLIHTWTLSAEVLEGDQLKFWQDAAGTLGLFGAGFAERVDALDQFIDEVEIAFDEIARENGLDVEQSSGI